MSNYSGAVFKLPRCGDMPPARALARGGLSRVPFEVGEAMFATICCGFMVEHPNSYDFLS